MEGLGAETDQSASHICHGKLPCIVSPGYFPPPGQGDHHQKKTIPSRSPKSGPDHVNAGGSHVFTIVGSPGAGLQRFPPRPPVTLELSQDLHAQQLVFQWPVALLPIVDFSRFAFYRKGGALILQPPSQKGLCTPARMCNSPETQPISETP